MERRQGLVGGTAEYQHDQGAGEDEGGFEIADAGNRVLRRSSSCYRPAQLQEDRMRTQIVMDATGDTRHHFDPTDPTAVAQAERRFIELKRAGFIAAKRTGNGASELIREFDPNAQETL